MQYMEKLVSGNQREKTELCFNLIDEQKKEYFTQEDLFTLIRSITASNTNSAAEMNQKLSKVQQISNYLFNRFDSKKSGKVCFEDFNDAIMDDGQLLEIFTLLNKGIYEHFITKTLEEGRRHWFMNQTKYISMSLIECLTMLEQQRSPRTFRDALQIRKVDSKPVDERVVESSHIEKLSPLSNPIFGQVKTFTSNFENHYDTSGQGIITPRDDPIHCTPGLYLDLEKPKKKKWAAGETSKYKQIDLPYESNPLQAIEIIAEDARIEQAYKEKQGKSKTGSPPLYQTLLPESLKKPLNIKPIQIEEFEGSLN